VGSCPARGMWVVSCWGLFWAAGCCLGEALLGCFCIVADLVWIVVFLCLDVGLGFFSLLCGRIVGF